MPTASETAAVPKRESRIPELDGIRGLAIGLVLVCHLFQVGARPGSTLAYVLVPLRLSWTGVDLFFVLSGFLIGGILLDARESSNYFRVFYTRRFFRIVPIYAVLLILAAAVIHAAKGGLIRGSEELYTGTLPWPFFTLFLQNIGMSLKQVWGTFPLSVTWSLAVEEQFYLTLPLFVRFLDRRTLVRTILAGIVAAPLLRTWFYYHNPENFFTWYALMPCRADALLLGVLGAIALRDANIKSRLLGYRKASLILIAVLLAGDAFLGWRAASFDSPLMATVGYTWLALTYLWLLLYGVLFTDSVVSGILRWSWLRGLGNIAYGTYLFHLLFAGLLFGRVPVLHSWSDVGMSCVALLVTLIFCRLSWGFFEKPLIRLGHHSRYQFSRLPVHNFQDA